MAAPLGSGRWNLESVPPRRSRSAHQTPWCRARCGLGHRQEYSQECECLGPGTRSRASSLLGLELLRDRLRQELGLPIWGLPASRQSHLRLGLVGSHCEFRQVPMDSVGSSGGRACCRASSGFVALPVRTDTLHRVSSNRRRSSGRGRAAESEQSFAECAAANGRSRHAQTGPLRPTTVWMRRHHSNRLVACRRPVTRARWQGLGLVFWPASDFYRQSKRHAVLRR